MTSFLLRYIFTAFSFFFFFPSSSSCSLSSTKLGLGINQLLNQLDILLRNLLPHQIGDVMGLGALLLGQQVEHQLAVLAHRIALLARIRPRLAQGLLTTPEARIVRPLGLLAVLLLVLLRVLVPGGLRERPGEATAAERLGFLLLLSLLLLLLVVFGR